MNNTLFYLLIQYDAIILDGSFLYFNDVAEDINTAINNPIIKATIYVFKSSIEIWNSFGNKDIFKNNLKALYRMDRNQLNNQLIIRESPYNNNLYKINQKQGKVAIVTQDKFESYLLSLSYENIDYLYFDRTYFIRLNSALFQYKDPTPFIKAEIKKPSVFNRYYTDTGKVSLIKKIGAGKEGTVFKLSDFSCAKFYFTDERNSISDLSINKLYEMIQYDYPENIISPEKLIYSDNDRKYIVGYTMKYVKGKPLSEIAKDRFFSIETKHKIIISMIKTILYIHSMGLMIGDYNLHNFIYANGMVYFIDTDNYYCNEYSCDAIADFVYSKRYIDLYHKTYKEMIFCEFESLILMIHYFYTNDEAYGHGINDNDKTELKINRGNIYLKEVGLGDDLINVLTRFLRRSNQYTLLELYQEFNKLL